MPQSTGSDNAGRWIERLVRRQNAKLKFIDEFGDRLNRKKSIGDKEKTSFYLTILLDAI